MINQIQRTTFKVSDFINWQKYGGLILSPKFQRRSVWNPGAKSFLIDTILKGLPIPVIILRDVKTNINSYESKKEVIDGQQRLRSIISFIAPELVPDEESYKIKAIHNQLAGGKTFTELPDDLKQEILDYEFFVHVLPSNVSDREILEIFSRMNSTGYKLNRQELRNAKYFGEFKTTVYNVALEFYEFWIKHGILTDSKISRMEEVEIMNDLFTVVLDGLIDRSPETISKYYEMYDETNTLPNKSELVTRVKTILNYIDQLLGDSLETLEFNKPKFFYSLFAVVYDLKYGLKSDIKIKSKPKKLNDEKLKQNIIELSKRIEDRSGIPDGVFISYTTGTNRLSARKQVFDFIKEQLNNGIEKSK